MTSSVSTSSSSHISRTSSATPALSVSTTKTTTASASAAGTHNAGVIASSWDTSSSPLKRTVVTAKRKEELLVQARAERKRWVRKVSLPYDSKQLARVVGNSGAKEGATGSAAAANGNDDAVNQLWSSRDGLDKLQNSLICGNRFLPGTTLVLSELYGISSAIDSDEDNDNNNDEGDSDNNIKKEVRDHPLSLNEVADRVERLSKPYWVEEQKEGLEPRSAFDSSDKKADLKLEITVKDATAQDGGDKTNTFTDEDDKYKDLRAAFLEFTDAMMLPESAVTVQGMKNFVQQFVTSSHSTKKYDDYESQVRNMSSVLNGHARLSYETFATKSTNNSNTGEGMPDWDRRSLESILYAQTKETVDTKLDQVLGNSAISPSLSSPFSMNQRSLDIRLEELQFLQPSHLEIACLSDDLDDQDVSSSSLSTTTGRTKLESLLKEPIKALRSVEAFYSPYEKLRRVLEVFRGVNAALSKTSKAVPSADDVLPTVILVVVKAAATAAKRKTKAPPLRNLLRDLYFIESFALPEYLRGEAGYAFTNLYGAVQFLQELELDTAGNSTSNRLSISPEELRLGLEKSRAVAAKNNARRTRTLGTSNDDERKPKGLISQGVDDLLRESDLVNSADVVATASLFISAPRQLSVREVRAARLRGEILDLEWALTHQEGEPRCEEPVSSDGASLPSSPIKLPSKSKLPQQRYTFLGLRPENVKMSDLPKLLDEYRKLVLTTEELLGEQQLVNSKIQAERKRQRDEKHRRSLGERALLR